MFSCRNNRLKTNEKELRQEILLLEKEKEESGRIASEIQMNDSLNSFPRAFRHLEDRTVDPKRPPVIIDIAGSLNNVNEIKLSDVATDISYIRIETVPDSTIPMDLKLRYYLLDNYIVGLNLYGIHLYSKNGRYIRSIVKNEFTGIKVNADRIMFWNDYSMKGGGLSVSEKGDKLFYKYSNNITGQKYLMEYDCSSSQIATNYKFDPENPDQISGLGNVAIDFNHGKTEAPKPRKHQGMFSGSPAYFFQNRSEFLFDPNTYALPVNGDNMMVLLNNQGDTLSAFTRFEQLNNYTKSLMRNTDTGIQYEKNGKLYIRPPFNDTVFQVIPPNRLLPVYVLNLESYKVSKQQGVDPDFNLAGKIIPESYAETEDFIFLTFTKDDYDCPNTRKNKTVKIYHSLYSKLDNKFSVIKGDPFNYSPEILENDIDGGIPVWPSAYMIGKSGELLISLKGNEIKERVKSEHFKLSGALEARKMELVQLASSVSNLEDILMIVK